MSYDLLYNNYLSAILYMSLNESWKFPKSWTLANNILNLKFIWFNSSKHTVIKLTSFYLQHNFGNEEPTQIWMAASVGSASMIADL